MSSEDFYYLKRKDLIDYILISEKLHNNVPIKFCFNGHFFCWDDIKTIIAYVEDNAKINEISLKTNSTEHTIVSFEEFMNITDLEDQVLKQFVLSTSIPVLKLEMNIQHIFIVSKITEQTMAIESKLNDFLSIFLNKGNKDNGWYCSGDVFFLLRPDNAPNLKNLG